MTQTGYNGQTTAARRTVREKSHVVRGGAEPTGRRGYKGYKKRSEAELYFRVGFVTVHAVKLIVLTLAGLICLKWFGLVMEVVSDHISVGAGVAAIFAAAAFFIYCDIRGASDRREPERAPLRKSGTRERRRLSA